VEQEGDLQPNGAVAQHIATRRTHRLSRLT
jgi:hypothetical protein